MRQKILDHGTGALADYELLEMLLFNVIPRRDTKPLAKSLLAHFGSWLSICQASKRELEDCHLGAKTIVMLQFIRQCAASLAMTDTHNPFCFADWERLLVYADRYTQGDVATGTRVIYVNNRNELLLDHFLTDESDIVSLHQQIAELALDVNATALILVYIAPRRPANVIAQHVLGLKHALRPLSIEVYDALLVGENWKKSLHQEGLLGEDE
ncbi:JAB domain-containing protein [Acetobacteraceae bacterium ESL0709]|nr:JAB domain-containing protein [Acetobacteraceae bacterium ESL0697]MDF7678020.1 JAB domain-containing protein [Acetobacteraceae bacterium ESL0709]